MLFFSLHYLYIIKWVRTFENISAVFSNTRHVLSHSVLHGLRIFICEIMSQTFNRNTILQSICSFGLTYLKDKTSTSTKLVSWEYCLRICKMQHENEFKSSEYPKIHFYYYQKLCHWIMHNAFVCILIFHILRRLK